MAMIHGVHPRDGPSISATITPASPSMMVTAPGMSGRPATPGSFDSSMCRNVIATATSAIGTLRKKTHRHDAASTSHPPTNGPSALVAPDIPAHSPTACPRSSSRIPALTSARLPGTSAAAATPCTRRATTNHSMVGARPHAIEAIANTISPPTNTALRPYRSPATPPVSSSALSVSMYPSTTHCCPASPVSRSRAMVGNATFTTVPSRKATPEPSTAEAISHRPFADDALTPGMPSFGADVCMSLPVSHSRGAVVSAAFGAARCPHDAPNARNSPMNASQPVLTTTGADDDHRR